MAVSTLTIKRQFISSTIFETDEECKTNPFEFKTTDLKNLAPTKTNYTHAKKMGVLLMMVNNDQIDGQRRKVG